MTKRNNTRKIESLVQALGTLVINGFDCDYDDDEYGNEINIKSGGKWIRLYTNHDFESCTLTVSELVDYANDVIEASNISNIGTQTLSFNDALNKF